MILKGSVFSKVLEMETGITIVIPTDFKNNNNYQAAYLLHGLCGSSGDLLNYTMLPVYANDYNAIIIMPDAARSFYTDMKYGQRYFTYLTEELPFICKTIFNISTKREDTAIIGASMGGYGALKSALSKPAQYGYCCAFSSPCLFLKEGLDYQRAEGETEKFRNEIGEQLIKDFIAMFGPELEWNPDNEILELAAKINSQTVKPKIYSACGKEDPFYYHNVRFKGEIKKLDFDFTFEEWPGVHDWYFFNEALKRALKFCFAGSPGNTLSHNK